MLIIMTSHLWHGVALVRWSGRELVELAGNHGDHTQWNLIVKALEKRLGVL